MAGKSRSKTRHAKKSPVELAAAGGASASKTKTNNTSSKMAVNKAHTSTASAETKTAGTSKPKTAKGVSRGKKIAFAAYLTVLAIVSTVFFSQLGISGGDTSTENSPMLNPAPSIEREIISGEQLPTYDGRVGFGAIQESGKEKINITHQLEERSTEAGEEVAKAQDLIAPGANREVVEEQGQEKEGVKPLPQTGNTFLFNKQSAEE